MSEMKVQDLMTGTVLSLGPDDNLQAAMDLMWENHLRHVPILDDEELVGLVTHRDLASHTEGATATLPLSAWGDMMSRVRIRDVMTPDVATVEPTDNLRLAAQTMLENKFGCLPVVEGGRLAGILTESDFVRCFANGD